MRCVQRFRSMHGVSPKALIAKMAEGREGKTFIPTGIAEVVNFESDEGFTHVASRRTATISHSNAENNTGFKV